MSNPNHPWCRDVSRDEAVRAAEDAAAVPAIQHRDLPDQVALLWASLGDILGRVVRLEAEMDAGEDEEAAPEVCDPASPVEGLRTERVTLEVTHDADDGHIKFRDWDDMLFNERRNGIRFPGESVRVVEETKGGRLPDMVAWITAERDAARAERDAALAEAERRLTMCESLKRDRDSADFYVSCLRARVAELEAAAKTAALLAEVRESEWRVASELAAEANAENAGVAAKQEPWAWAVLGRGIIRAISVSRSDAEDAQAQFACDTTVVPLYAAPPEPRGWLTAVEEDAVDHAADIIEDMEDDDGSSLKKKADALRALLARSSPPRVKVPNLREQNTWLSRDEQWIAAIREAGGEVAE